MSNLKQLVESTIVSTPIQEAVATVTPQKLKALINKLDGEVKEVPFHKIARKVAACYGNIFAHASAQEVESGDVDLANVWDSVMEIAKSRDLNDLMDTLDGLAMAGQDGFEFIIDSLTSVKVK